MKKLNSIIDEIMMAIIIALILAIITVSYPFVWFKSKISYKTYLKTFFDN